MLIQRLEEELVFKDQELLELRKELNAREIKIKQLQVCQRPRFLILNISSPFSYSVATFTSKIFISSGFSLLTMLLHI